MSITVFDLPTKIIFGAGSLQELGKEAVTLGRKTLLVTCPDIRKTGILETALNDLTSHGLETVVFEEVEPNPRSTTVDRGAAIARREKAELVIGLGGGSAMDAAKGIALASSDNYPIWHYAESRPYIRGTVPPIIQVPTLAGTGAEVSRGAVITNPETSVKKSIISPFIQATIAIIDPETTLSVPDFAMRSGAVDAFSHVVEPYITSAEKAPLTDGIRETVMKIVLRYLPEVIKRPDDMEVRTQLSWASTVAMSQIARLGGGGGIMTCHGLGHALSGYYDIAHGASLAALLPTWMKFNYRACRDRFAQLGKNLFSGKQPVETFEVWLQENGMKLRLRELGLELERTEDIAALAVKSSASLARNPVPIDEAAAARIYRDAY